MGAMMLLLFFTVFWVLRSELQRRSTYAVWYGGKRLNGLGKRFDLPSSLVLVYWILGL
jgi:hypothetical protein